MNIQNIKSFHCIPVINEKYLINLRKLFSATKPGAIILDFEDSIHPDFKNEARSVLAQYYQNIIDICFEFGVLCGLRINNRNTSWYNDDIAFLSRHKFDFIDLPKVESPGDINDLRSLCNTPIAACIETIGGMYYADIICSALDKNRDILFVGHEDPCADYMIERPLDLSSFNPLSFFIVNCLTAGRRNKLVVIDGPSREFKEEFLNNFEKECLLELQWGFDGKISIHPNQINIINKVFSDKQKIENAVEIVEKFNDLDTGITVAVNKKGDMMDAPSLRMYGEIKNKPTNL